MALATLYFFTTSSPVFNKECLAFALSCSHPSVLVDVLFDVITEANDAGLVGTPLLRGRYRRSVSAYGWWNSCIVSSFLVLQSICSRSCLLQSTVPKLY